MLIIGSLGEGKKSKVGIDLMALLAHQMSKCGILIRFSVKNHKAA